MKRMNIFNALMMLCLAFVAGCGHNSEREHRDYPNLLFVTELGEFVIEVYPDKAPISVAHFLQLVDQGTYDGQSFYQALRPDTQQPLELVKGRVLTIAKGGLLVGGLQGNDLAGQSASKPVERIEHESTRHTGLSHVQGAVSWGRPAKGKAGTEFLISVGRQPAYDFGGSSTVDGEGLAVFGKVIRGMGVVENILYQPTKGVVQSDDVIPGYRYFAGEAMTQDVVDALAKSYLRPQVAILRVRRL